MGREVRAGRDSVRGPRNASPHTPGLEGSRPRARPRAQRVPRRAAPISPEDAAGRCCTPTPTHTPYPAMFRCKRRGQESRSTQSVRIGDVRFPKPDPS
jgi:hypothetical protein